MGRKCKVCGSSDLTFYSYGNHKNRWNLHILKLQIARLFPFVFKLFRSGRDINDVLLFCPLYKIARCRECGYGVYERNVSTDVLNSYYRSAYWGASGTSTNERHDEGAPYLNDSRAGGQYTFIRRYFLEDKIEHILEIGAGSALFSRLARHHHPRVRIDVVEPGYGWERYYEVNDIEKVSDFFPYGGSRQYGYVHTSHWLEHVIPDIEAVVGAIDRVLIPGGLLFIEVPNCDEEYWDIDQGDIPHVHFFTRQSLARVFERAGFTLLKIDTFGATNRENFDYLHPSTRMMEPPAYLISEVDRSIRESIPREHGDSLRGLFRKSL